MDNRNLTLRRYYRNIRNYLPCTGHLKKQILAEIQTNVNDYLENNSEADIQQIVSRFGSPQNIAAAYVNDMNTEELLQALYIRKRIVTAIICCIMAVLLIWGTAISVAHQSVLARETIYIETEIVEIGE